MKLGSWARPMLSVLASLKGLRGTAFDLFGYSTHRRLERSLPGWYKDLIREAVTLRDSNNAGVAFEIANIADQIRGYEQIKEESITRAKKLASEKLAWMKGIREPQPVAR